MQHKDMDPAAASPAQPDVALRRALEEAGLAEPASLWQRLPGGRTNIVWRVDTGSRSLVCKLHCHDRATPLFPNDPDAELAAMRFMAPLGLAPGGAMSLNTVAGPCLIYDHVPDRAIPVTASDIGRTLSRVHDQAPPVGLRRVADDIPAILAQAEDILRTLPVALRARLATHRPAFHADALPARLCLLHGDPAPDNILATPDGPILIDWQCPAAGDPAHDLAVFLSPAMHVLAGRPPLSETDRHACLVAHGAAQRFAAVEPAHLWRMAVHCGWRLAHGESDCKAAMEAELERLNQLDQPIDR
ncbi:phosphotransferase family protein [Oceaniovalibus sp. ACAM 378]|uniref:phosphotransferase family protein n=1 Tax=Oceaniovalibus sp. ACAM 378 TaxID=2599923 RepID=UPI0011D5B1F2|nr:phosphotransferase [Oceaniovalibus sp. ACAM 378]TYB84922.1 phosphotransferase [Oceaniovalibus sp. ACAM 378]